MLFNILMRTFKGPGCLEPHEADTQFIIHSETPEAVQLHRSSNVHAFCGRKPSTGRKPTQLQPNPHATQ